MANEPLVHLSHHPAYGSRTGRFIESEVAFSGNIPALIHNLSFLALTGWSLYQVLSFGLLPSLPFSYDSRCKPDPCLLQAWWGFCAFSPASSSHSRYSILNGCAATHQVFRTSQWCACSSSLTSPIMWFLLVRTEFCSLASFSTSFTSNNFATY